MCNYCLPSGVKATVEALRDCRDAALARADAAAARAEQAEQAVARVRELADNAYWGTDGRAAPYVNAVDLLRAVDDPPEETSAP